MKQEQYIYFDIPSTSSDVFLENKSIKPYYESQTHIEWLVNHCGTDSLSYLALENGKHYFLSASGDGVISYALYRNVAVCIGNPICNVNNWHSITSEFINYCKDSNLHVCFCSITSSYSKLLVEHGLHIASYGQEAILDLHSYVLKGKKTEKLRQKYNRSTKSGIQVLEYTPLNYRNADIEEKIDEVSQSWFAQKGKEMNFAFGDLHFDNPLGRRYFIALDSSGDCQSIITFSPYDEKQGYYLDVMRRHFNAIPGVMEKTILDAITILQEEHATRISLGIAPLSGLPEKPTHILEILFRFIYEYGNFAYDFQSLYQFKNKFNPSIWEPRYVAYDKKLRPLLVGYAMIKVRNIDHLTQKVQHCLLDYIKNKGKIT
jgi:phosphatidylglycerol lysyltransferase